MWVVKLGGSLCSEPVLPQWLDLLAQLGGGRVTLVGGGGTLADEVRRLQLQWEFSDLAAHNMAVLAMAQTAYQFNAMNPALQLASSRSDIRRVLQKGQTALWLPFELQREQADAQTTWDVTSDSLALDLARRLNAERLVVVKSCRIEPRATLTQLSEDGVVDKRFASLSEGAAFPIEILHKDEPDAMRALLYQV
jgi:5-(aminomethyl)-3-furanmethanol phosphate kinase